MRYLILLALSCSLWAATPTVVQKKVANTGSGSSVSTASMTTTTGNTVAVACIGAGTTNTMTVSDGTNTYTAQASGATTLAAEGQARWYVAKNITGVTHAITCTPGGSPGGPWFISIFAYEINGASTTAPVDVPTSAQSGGNTGTSAAPSFTMPATTFANDLLLFVSACGNTCSAGSGVDAGNSQSDANGDESETYSKTATGTYTGSFSQTSGSFIVSGTAITDGNGGGGATCTPTMTLMGVGQCG